VSVAYDAAMSSPVSEHMTASVVSVTENTSLEEVVKTLRRLDISCVLVTTIAGAPAGVVSLTDLARISKLEGGHHGPLHIVPPDRRAKDVMKTPIVGVDADADVSEAASVMLEHRVHRVFVRRGERIVGVFSTRDALRVVLFRRVETPLRDVMTTPVETIGVGDVIDDAVAKLEATNVRGLVVVDGKKPVGVFTQMEAIRARALTPELRQRPVEEIMSYETLNLDADTPLYRAAGHAIATKVRRILAIDGRTIAGIVTGYDLAHVLAS
jgi:CBS domain-containing protein